MKDSIQKQLGKRIQYLRKIKNYSQEVFAEKIGIATNTLSNIERGNAFMTAQTLDKILKILDISPAELFSQHEKITDNEMLKSIQKKLNFIKSDPEKLRIMYNFINSLI